MQYPFARALLTAVLCVALCGVADVAVVAHGAHALDKARIAPWGR
jgi:hypothetical protein